MSRISPPDEDAPYLTLTGVSKYYGAVRVLDDVSFSIRKGEFICFLGPSGCGKTTLLRVIAGLETQNTGDIRQDGREITRLPAPERDFGIVFQSYALFPNLTATENVGFGLKGRGLSRGDIARRCAELLELVGIPEHAGKYPSQLSGGQQQRVAIARAIAMQPGLLLLDEPLSALDARVRARLREEMRDLQRKLGITTIMVTHDQDEALSMADRVIVMNRGRVEQFDTPSTIYRAPHTPFVAHFVGDINTTQALFHDGGQVRVGGRLIGCRSDRHYRAATPVLVAIRPEDIVLRPAAVPASDVFSAMVEAIEFSGVLSRIRLSVPDFSVDPIHACVLGSQIDTLNIRQGEELPVAFPADRLMLFPVEGGAAC
ncbi:putative 2-aminoethylphosphonate ABC transporter ATP-binding protein [Ancylobacter terrae]|uniref:putative 2-aminoethylphosphonate ABC transporter ATP-binding protein n=1 Tax=Ancylobacter sp. sgz301288 TaxID=3342077 RepID=UPI00385B87AA